MPFTRDYTSNITAPARDGCCPYDRKTSQGIDYRCVVGHEPVSRLVTSSSKRHCKKIHTSNAGLIRRVEEDQASSSSRALFFYHVPEHAALEFCFLYAPELSILI